ncbi:uncharacterized protein BDZ99DRAFT_469494 [Mytilinidion resinicola]|uniref:Uncharacterized protein n=1 Tax=Mytilinidion resinicola TaxID=574789 RepID=A0A6A6Y1S4_9PEZI|nr:uncharacterized protein BDZ99DRAFT_469494 [Mytilinidion resinicola]KAF2801757.1 hypothetical protein BDZ99DRAFT_469494 [Mytilinidion resinicola]
MVDWLPDTRASVQLALPRLPTPSCTMASSTRVVGRLRRPYVSQPGCMRAQILKETCYLLHYGS